LMPITAVRLRASTLLRQTLHTYSHDWS